MPWATDLSLKETDENYCCSWDGSLVGLELQQAIALLLVQVGVMLHFQCPRIQFAAESEHPSSIL